MPDRPNPSLDDPLSDVFRSVRFTRALYYTVSTAPGWPAIRVPRGVEIAGALAPARDVISYHVVVEGSCWAALEGGDPVLLQAGEVVVYPRGHAYVLAPDRTTVAGQPDVAGMVALLHGVAVGELPARFVHGEPGVERTRFVCGFLGRDPDPFDPLVDALPPMFRIRGSDGRLGRLVELALTEPDGAGDSALRERLSESMFIETVRRYLETQGSERPGWVGGSRDPLVGHALALLHGSPAAPWTLSSLAGEVGASRSALAQRFTGLVGQPPMRYLAAWRMHMAGRLLSDQDAKVSDVARRVGYESEAAFSRAFKRATGASPAAWRGPRNA